MYDEPYLRLHRLQLLLQVTSCLLILLLLLQQGALLPFQLADLAAQVELLTRLLLPQLLHSRSNVTMRNLWTIPMFLEVFSLSYLEVLQFAVQFVNFLGHFDPFLLRLLQQSRNIIQLRLTRDKVIRKPK